MNLTWHIVKKDLLRLRLPVLLWVGVLAGQVYVSNSLLSERSVDVSWFYQMGTFFNLLGVFGLVVTYILVAILILDDALAGTNMFWVTRPIAGGRLLCAKVLVALLLFGLLPLLVWLPWWLYCGFRFGDLVTAAGQVLWVQAVAIVPAFLLASLIDQLGRFLLFSLLLVFAVLVALLNLLSRSTGDEQSLSWELLQPRLLLAAGLIVVFGIGVLWQQYFKRKVVSSSLVLVAGVTMAVMMVFGWPVDLPNFLPKHPVQLAGSDQIKSEFKPATMGSYKDHEGDEHDTVTICLGFKEGLDEVKLSGGVADLELRWPDGLKIRKDHVKMMGEDYPGDISDMPLRRALGLKAVPDQGRHHWDPATDARYAELRTEDRQRQEKRGYHPREFIYEPGYAKLSITLAVTPEQAARIKVDPPACSISARIETKSPEVLLEFPFKSGERLARDGERLHILSVAKVRYPQDLSPRPNDYYRTTVVSVTAPGLKNNVELFLVDRVHGQVGFVNGWTAFSAMPMAANIVCLPFDLGAPVLWRANKWAEVPDWEKSATLASVIYHDAGGFDRDFHTDQLIVSKPESDVAIK